MTPLPHCFIAVALVAPACFATTTNLYHTNRVFKPITFSASSAPTAYQVYTMAGELTQVVGPTNVFINSNLTQAVEYEGFAWGYGSANSAWTSAVAVYQSYYQVHAGTVYDNVGWVKGTKESYGTWGAYLWYLQNQIAFTSSVTNVWISGQGVTNPIALVLVGSIGDFPPKTPVYDVGPTNWAQITNFLGAGAAEDAIYKPDLDAYYKLLVTTMTIYVDQPGKGGRRTPVADYGISITGRIKNDAGHVFWRLQISDLDALPPDLRGFANVNVGFYPDNVVDPIFARTSPGHLERPDDSHLKKVDVFRTFPIPYSAFTNALEYTRDIWSSHPTYDLNDYNCVDAALRAASRAGLSLPDSRGEWTGGGGSNAADFGEDLRNLPQ